MLIRNSWYVAAWSNEVGNDRPFGRIILAEPIVSFRTIDGSVVALEGRCAHRHMSLKNGKIIGDNLVCCYHGLTYDYFGFSKADSGDIDSHLPEGAGKVTVAFYQLIAPETKRSTHFFKLGHCEWPKELLPKLLPTVEAVNDEDNRACEEQKKWRISIHSHHGTAYRPTERFMRWDGRGADVRCRTIDRV
jgi:phenylpropionate dioxygenase-like ring-hydroxylating dioxygenase large terminal subunit